MFQETRLPGRASLNAIILAVITTLLPVAAHGAGAKHVILLSIDGLHAADLGDPALAPVLVNINALRQSSISYTNATGTTPSDSFPGTLAYLTGAGPATTGVYYDDTFCRSLIAPGHAPGELGAQVENTDAIDKDSSRLDSGGDSGFDSLDPAKLPLDPANGAKPAYPHSYLKVNTILELAHQAGLRTSVIDKHPAYEIAAGPSGKGIDDLYCPEIEAKVTLVNGTLVGPPVPNWAPLIRITKNADLAIAYDDLKFAALLRELHGSEARGNGPAPVPGIVAINLQAVNVAEKTEGGIPLVDKKEVPTPALLAALAHTDKCVKTLCDELHATGLWDQTLIVLTAKHGQDPRVGEPKLASTSVLKDALAAAGVSVAVATLDDGGIIWLKDSSQTAAAADAINKLAAGTNNPGIDKVLSGDSLRAANLAGAPDRTPDLVLVLKPGYIFMDKPTKHAEHGGFCEDDTHVPLILAGGTIADSARGAVVEKPVKTTQVAVTVLEALGLNPAELQGAKIEGTQALELP